MEAGQAGGYIIFVGRSSESSYALASVGSRESSSRTRRGGHCIVLIASVRLNELPYVRLSTESSGYQRLITCS
jgi:hypothetical protein